MQRLSNIVMDNIVPIVIAALTVMGGAIGYVYTIDKRITILEQSSLAYEDRFDDVQDDIRVLDGKIDKMHNLLVHVVSNKGVSV
jgi:hypothetical protein